MRETLRSHFSSPHFWRNLAFSSFVALIAGHLVVSHDKDYSLLELLGMRRYYYSLAINSLAALVLIEFVHMVSRRLYRRFKPEGLGRRWLLLQCTLGLGLTVLLELVIASTLFAYHGQWIWETSFYRNLFIPIVIFIVMLNCFFAAHYLHIDPKVKTVVRSHFFSPEAAPELSHEFKDQPKLIFIRDEKCFYLSFQDREFLWQDSIEASEKSLPSSDYFRGRREWMVHRLGIIGVVNLKGKRLQVILSGNSGFELIISRRRSPAFKRWWGGEAREKGVGKVEA